MISGKCFADRCSWVFDPRYPDRRRFSYAEARSGDWVFVNGDYLPQFRAQCPLFSPKQFFILVHNTDRSFGLVELGMLLPLSRHIYAVNTVIDHPRVTTIPLGFVDRQLPFLETFQRPDVPRDITVYANFTQTTNDERRRACVAAFKDDPRVTWRTGLSVPEYYADLCRSTFVLCPEGTGIDTHRVYEALLCGATPVVLRNSLAGLYSRLPVCIVDRWTDPFVIPSSQPISFDPGSFLTQRA
jgi:hypothetical protein